MRVTSFVLWLAELRSKSARKEESFKITDVDVGGLEGEEAVDFLKEVVVGFFGEGTQPRRKPGKQRTREEWVVAWKGICIAKMEAAVTDQRQILKDLRAQAQAAG